MSREMKHSGAAWIGNIPKHWDVGRYKFCGTMEKGKLPSETNIEGKGLPIIGASEMNGKPPRQFTEEKLPMCTEQDILILWDGANAGLIAHGMCGIVSSTAVVLKRDTEKLISDYLYYQLKSNETFFRDKVNGTTIPHMNSAYIDELPPLIPPLAEQQAIADFLDKKCNEIDELVSLQEKMIEELKAYKQSVITEAVCKGLNPNVPMKDSGVEWIVEIPKGWQSVPFRAIYNLTKGLNITKENLVENGVPVISYGQIHSKENSGTCIKESLLRYVPETYLIESPTCLVKKGDIIFADTSEDLEGCGNGVYIDKNMQLFAGYHTIIAQAQDIRGITKYLSYLFLTGAWRSQIRSMVNGVKLYSIPQKLLRRTTIILPPIAEQEEIADYLDKKCSEIDQLISIKQQKIVELKDYKKSLIYEYTTGKKEVKL